MMSAQLGVELAEDLLETIAQRVATLLGEQRGVEGGGYLDVAAAAEFLACPKSRIYALVSARRIPHHRDGSRLLFDRSELREFVDGGGARRP